MESPSPVPGRTIGNGVLTLWYDAFVHGDDIRAALGQPSRPSAFLNARLDPPVQRTPDAAVP